MPTKSKKITTHTQPKRQQARPVSLYDPDGSLAYSIDALAAIMEHDKGVPVSRATAVRQTMIAAALEARDKAGLDAFQLEKLVSDYRQRHNL